MLVRSIPRHNRDSLFCRPHGNVLVAGRLQPKWRRLEERREGLSKWSGIDSRDGCPTGGGRVGIPTGPSQVRDSSARWLVVVVLTLQAFPEPAPFRHAWR
jgi:hypothetical protein